MSAKVSAIHTDDKVVSLASEIALEGYTGPGKQQFESKPALEALIRLGSELWFDTGDESAAHKVWSREVKGLTTNNTLINQVIQTGALDDAITSIGQRLRQAHAGMAMQDIVIEAAFILNAKIALGLVQTFGAKVSVELHPDLGDDWETTVAFGKRYFAICPENFIIKVPMTPDGFIAVRKLSDAGVPVNFTLGFSVRQNYFAALFSHPEFVNVFLGRLGVLVKDNNLGTGDNIGERVTLASQEAMEQLREAHPDVRTRQIAASLRTGKQVGVLAGVDVQTIPPKAAQEYLDTHADTTSIRRHASTEFPVEVKEASDKIAALWEVSEQFKTFTADAVRSVQAVQSGSDILEIAEANGVSDFFRRWKEDEQAEIRKAGKIPDFHKWQSAAAVDDLMSQAALQSFIVDQGALDMRIARMIG